MESYNAETARHYNAYRPPVHGIILKRLLGAEKFVRALDVGCGTGVSSEALLAYSENVVGIDPSEDMLSRAGKHERILYRKFDGKVLPFKPSQFDLITFAGSLNYSEKKSMAHETIRVAAQGCKVVVYDFAVDMDRVLHKLSLSDIPQLDYDHDAGFDEFGAQNMSCLDHGQSTEQFDIEPDQLAHLLLSDERITGRLSSMGTDSFSYVVKLLHDRVTTGTVKIQARTFSRVYHIRK